MKYIVSELQINVDGTITTPENIIFNTKPEAEAYYYSRLSFAATSTSAKHSVGMLDEDFRLIHRQSFNHVVSIAQILDANGNTVTIESPNVDVQESE